MTDKADRSAKIVEEMEALVAQARQMRHEYDLILLKFERLHNELETIRNREKRQFNSETSLAKKPPTCRRVVTRVDGGRWP